MAAPDGLLFFIGLLGISSLIIGAFFIIRGVYRFKDWMAGEKDELWRWLSFFTGGVAAIFISTVPLAIVGNATEYILVSLFSLVTLGLFLGLAAIALTTVYYILKWIAVSKSTS